MLVVRCAGVAQLVELLICNQPVAGSSPVTSLFLNLYEAMFCLGGEFVKRQPDQA